jgi:hypothetical protein
MQGIGPPEGIQSRYELGDAGKQDDGRGQRPTVHRRDKPAEHGRHHPGARGKSPQAERTGIGNRRRGALAQQVQVLVRHMRHHRTGVGPVFSHDAKFYVS